MRAGFDKAEETTKFQVAKVDEGEGIVYGYAFVCKVNGKPYVDSQRDYIPERAMLKAAYKFSVGMRKMDQMHDEVTCGQVVYLFPLTTEIAKAFNIRTDKTGLLIGVKPTPDVLAKFKSGTYKGFSIGGERETEADVVVKDGMCPECGNESCSCTDELAGAA